VTAFDLDGDGGLNASDLSRWLGEFASGVPYLRGDYSGDSTLDARDLSVLLTVFAAGGSVVSCGP